VTALRWLMIQGILPQSDLTVQLDALIEMILALEPRYIDAMVKLFLQMKGNTGTFCRNLLKIF
jgi:hypothetical protein